MFFFESFYYFYSPKTKLFYNEMKHIRLIFSAILLSLVVPCGYAQTRQDSLAIAHAQWHTDTLKHGQYACTRIYTYSIHPNKFLS